MPCNSDHLAPNDRERELQRAARLLVYVQRQTGRIPDDWLIQLADDIYAKNDRAVTELCATLRAMNPQVREVLVYDSHYPTARDLADWWDEHQAVDAARQQRETEQAGRS
jgi:hypothetical protein